MNQVIISNDVETLGPEATVEDLERYRANLERLLNEEFGDTCVDARVMHATKVYAR